MNPAAKVDIREVCLRDGLQIEDPIPLSAKIAILEAIVATGVREVEATAFVSPSKVPALADAAELAAELYRFPDVEFSALMASPNGAKRAIAAGLRSVEYVVSASDAHSKANVGRTSAEATAGSARSALPRHRSPATGRALPQHPWRRTRRRLCRGAGGGPRTAQRAVARGRPDPGLSPR